MLAVLGMFGSASLLLAASGLYTVLAFAVAQRTREIAIRLVLGADQAALIRMVFTNAMAIVAWAVVAGLVAAMALTRFISAMLVDVDPLDPVSILIVPVVLLLTAALAALLPARRAARLSPSAALLAE
jgi:ABC-type antimicrobial peptide transport system permease subunit